MKNPDETKITQAKQDDRKKNIYIYTHIQNRKKKKKGYSFFTFGRFKNKLKQYRKKKIIYT